MPETCLQRAWSAHRAELLNFLRHRLQHTADAEDVLQEVFVKALGQGSQFCTLSSPRAWLFHVARNVLADRLRVARSQIALPDEIAAPETEEAPAVDALAQCLPRVLSELAAEDRLAITLCDIEGMTQAQLAEHLGISLSGAKSRIQRARRRLREGLERGCRVCFDDEGRVIGFTPRPPLHD
jgi:RNA polymerase sigma-70 factor (ECF subfamily)